MPTTILLLILATFFWGANFNLAGYVLADMNALAAASLRFVVAAALMLAACQLRGERVQWRRHGARYALLGVIGIAGFNLLFFLGMRSTSAVNGALIMAASPLLTALFAFLFTAARLSPRQLLALPIALGGVALVVLGGGAQARVAPGDWLMIGAALCWASYNVLAAQKMPRDASSFANTTGIMTVGALVLTAVAGFSGAAWSQPGPGALLSLLVMATAGTVLAYLFYNAGIARLGAPRAALFMNIVPVSAMLISCVQGKVPGAMQLAGGAAVVAAVLLASWPGRTALVAAR